MYSSFNEGGDFFLVKKVNYCVYIFHLILSFVTLHLTKEWAFTTWLSLLSWEKVEEKKRLVLFSFSSPDSGFIENFIRGEGSKVGKKKNNRVCVSCVASGN